MGEILESTANKELAACKTKQLRLTSLVGTVSLVGLTVGDPGTTGFGEGGDTTGLDVGEDVTGDLLGFLVGESVIGDSVGDPGATGLRVGLSVGAWNK